MDTVLDRLQAAGLSDEPIQWHLDAGTVRLDGEVVTRPVDSGALAGQDRAVVQLAPG
jgi:hypothetical protein